jgi:hypothetical protein
VVAAGGFSCSDEERSLEDKNNCYSRVFEWFEENNIRPGDPEGIVLDRNKRCRDAIKGSSSSVVSLSSSLLARRNKLAAHG